MNEAHGLAAVDELATPYNLEAERAVIGAVLISNDLLASAAAILRPQDFFRVAHQRLWSSMLMLGERGDPIDLVTLRALVGVDDFEAMGGPCYISGLLDGVPRSTNVTHYARIVKGFASSRRIVEYSRDAIATFSEDPSALANGAGARFVDAVRRVVEDAHENSDNGPGYSQDLETFLSEAPSVRPPLVEGLIPSAGMVLLHGHPRSRKSYVVIDTLLGLAAGAPPLALPRLVVGEPTPCWYITEEDHQAEVARRCCALLAGRKMERPPLFRLSVRTGITLDDPRCQDQIIREALAHKVRAIAFDPIRAVSAAVDKGPGDLAPLARSLRRLMIETDATIILPHHDTKPRNDGKPDDRPRAQRASGGGLFSIAEAPIHVERVNEESSLLVPNSWKHSTDPPAIKVRVTAGVGWMRLQGEDVEAEAVAELALHERT